MTPEIRERMEKVRHLIDSPNAGEADAAPGGASAAVTGRLRHGGDARPHGRQPCPSGGTALGRQELEGELIDEPEDTLWTRAMLEACRARPADLAALGPTPLARVVVAVDPPAGTDGDACGIVVAGLGTDGRAWVIEDASLAGAGPERWAARAAGAAAMHGADRVIAEANNGGAMVESVLRAAEADLPVRLVHASRGKSARAEPVAALYERRRVAHLGAFPALEDQMCGLLAGGGYVGPSRSPDRADALVWALTDLMLGRRGAAHTIRLLG